MVENAVIAFGFGVQDPVNVFEKSDSRQALSESSLD
tara:strand:- start:1110 stop:1217 length:108 start_codon:yes stop_codon:yes gene_type:complete